MSTREKLVDAIIELAGDEFQSRHDIFNLAKESEEELIDRVINIAHYYKQETE
jgi:hypothetical protein